MNTISEVKLSEATASAPDHFLQLQALQIFTRKSILVVSAPHPSAEFSEQLCHLCEDLQQ